MYTKHFGLSALPFENVPDPAFFFDSGDYHRVLQRMTDSLAAGKGLMAVAGPIGAGKTTLSQKLMADLPETTRLVWLAEPPASAAGLLLFVAQELGLEDVPEERVFAMRDLRAHLLWLSAAGKHCLVIIDESHLACDDTLEGVRLLNNLEEGPKKLLQIILLGQQELVEKFARPELEPFRQRIAALEVIGRMDPPRLREYVLHRLKVAGAQTPIFSESALETVSVSTGGIPRVTNSLCDRSLRVAWEAGAPTVEASEVHQAAIDLGLGRKTLHYILKMRSEQQVKGDGPPQREPAAEEAPSDDTDREEKPLRSPEKGEEGVKKGKKARLGGPLLFLLLSIAAFAGSISFYCSRVGSLPAGRCLEKLVRSLF
jgi:type II secretory pathway predicted ATPase ExeA